MDLPCATSADGIGNWYAIEAEFSTGRTANGLRKRWSENSKRASSPGSALENVKDENSDRSRGPGGQKVRSALMFFLAGVHA